MLGLCTQLVMLSEAKDVTDASISIADRRIRARRGQVNDKPAHRAGNLLAGCLSDWFAQSGIPGQPFRLVGGLPREIRIGAAEMSIRRRLLIDGTPQLQRFNDALRFQLEMRAH